ncbi:MAG TPA: DUF2249 domain-containing protein [Flavisolibacter sp.]|nr:DUF2249 domain-containing protein [Flavisolibacter sp.]
MTINANTKIAALLKQNAKALDAIVSISPRFEKLRNPLLRKIMAGRTSLAAASKFGGCTIEDFYQKLEPLGFEIDRQTKTIEQAKPLPHFITSLTKEQLVDLDVRPVLAAGNDPLNIIMQKVKTIERGQVLRIINTFEPTPLIQMLEKKGFETYVDVINTDHIETYFHKTAQSKAPTSAKPETAGSDWEQIEKRFEEKMQKIDVRGLEMPKPMLTILEALDRLPHDAALYVYHKRIPVFLLPELAQKGFEYRIKEISDGEVRLLIFKN